MEVHVNEHRQIRLKDVFEPIELVSPEGDTLTIAMRDGGFEIVVSSIQPFDNTRHFSWYKTVGALIEPLTVSSPTEDIK